MTTSGRFAAAKYDSGVWPFLASGSEDWRAAIIFTGQLEKGELDT